MAAALCVPEWHARATCMTTRRQPDGYDESQLLAALRRGDAEAFAALVDRHHAGLVRLAAVWASNHDVAEDVVQDTWVAVIDGLDRFEGRSSLKTWIVGILINKARSHGKRERRTVPSGALGQPELGGPPVDPGRFYWVGRWKTAPGWWDDDTPERLVLASESLALVERAIAQLPSKQRAVLILRDVEGWEASEVCNVLELKETNQRVLLHRARSRIREALEDHVTSGRRT